MTKYAKVGAPPMGHWQILGIEPSADLRVIKRAYAVVLKQHKPETDPKGYQRVRAAFDAAIEQAKFAAQGNAVNGEPSAKADAAQPLHVPADAQAPWDSSSTFEASDVYDPEPPIEPPLPQFRAALRAFEVAEPPPRASWKESSTASNSQRRQQHGRQHEAPAATPADVLPLLDELLDLVRDPAIGHPAERLRELLDNHPDLVNLDARRRFEQALADEFALWHSGPFPIALCEAAVERFGWDSPTASDERLEAPIELLRERLEAASAVADLRASLAGQPWWRPRKRHQLIAQALLGPTSRWRFRRILLSSELSSDMRTLIGRLEKQCPLVFDYELDGDVPTRWRAELERPQHTLVDLGLSASFAVFAGMLAWYRIAMPQAGTAHPATWQSTWLPVAFGVAVGLVTLVGLAYAILSLRTGWRSRGQHVWQAMRWRAGSIRASIGGRLVIAVIVSAIMLALPLVDRGLDFLLAILMVVLVAFVTAGSIVLEYLLGIIGLICVSMAAAWLHSVVGIASAPAPYVLFIATLWCHVLGTASYRWLLALPRLHKLDPLPVILLVYAAWMCIAAVLAGAWKAPDWPP